MKRIVLVVILLLLFMLFFAPVTASRAQQRQMGGRPGEFHFILKDQADHNRAQFRDMQVRLARMRSDIATSQIDEAKRQRMLADLDEMGGFVSSMEIQFTIPAGQTAGEVEQRLNYAKGETACQVCHDNNTRTPR